MTDLQWWHLATEKYQEQGGKCPKCGEPLCPDNSGKPKPGIDSGMWPLPQLAHKVKRSVVVAKLGKRYEWDLRVLDLVHAGSKRGKSCNDGALLGAAHPIDEEALFARIKEEDGIEAQPLRSE